MKKISLIVAMLTFTMLGIAKDSPQSKTIEIEVGKIENGGYLITANLEELAERFNTRLEEQGFTETVSFIEIIRGTIDEMEGEEYYILVGQDSTGSVKIAVDLEIRDGSFYLQVGESNRFAGSSCTCTGCRRGCNPRHEIESGLIFWYCSACVSSGTCTKSVTASDL